MTAQDKAKLMRETRARRRRLGLVEFRRWCTPDEKKQLEQYADKLQKKG